MNKSIHGILTTHTGSLPRPKDLLAMIEARDAGRPYDRSRLATRLRAAVAEIVRKQVETGIDVVNDGEMSKIGYSTYVKDRLTGFEGAASSPLTLPELDDFPEYGARLFADPTIRELRRPTCVGPIAYRGREALREDLESLRMATSSAHAKEVFVSAASPGVIALFLENRHYRTQEEYLFALADAMREEYEAIHRAGFVLQLDCPDMTMMPSIELHVEALNAAVKNIPPERMRLHVCWGNYEGPHHKDVELHTIVHSLLRVRPSALSIVAANARHEHEWRVFESVKLPEEKVLIPGVIDSTTNIIEHPDTVADRICRFASVVGRENVIAGTDCGFATFASYALIDPKIAWAKLASMVEGARRATKILWA